MNRITILVFFIVSCTSPVDSSHDLDKKDSIEIAVDSTENVNDIDPLKEERAKNIQKVWKAIENNDENLYRETAKWFRFHPHANDFMFFSIMMAYKNNSPSAHYDILRFYNRGEGFCKKTDTVFLNFILYNLARAHEMGYTIGSQKVSGIDINEKTIRKSGYYLSKMPKE